MLKKIFFILLLLGSYIQASNSVCDYRKITYMKIATGSKKGTYIKIGRDLAGIVAPNSCVALKPILTHGSIDNIGHLLNTKYVALAIVQSDVLGFYRDRAINGDIQAKKIIDRLRLVKPLYIEEVHFIVKKDSLLRKVQDIENAKINIGPIGSGTAMSSKLIYKELFGHDINSNKQFTYSYDEALSKLINGDIDVVIMVGGQPLKKLSDLPEDVKRVLKLLEYDDNAAKTASSYAVTYLKKSNYKWIDSDVKTLGVPSYLVTFNYGREANRYQIKMKKALARIGYNLKKQLSNNGLLKTIGHPKWKEVKETLEEPLRGWQYYDVTKFSYNFSSNNCNDEAKSLTLCQ